MPGQMLIDGRGEVARSIAAAEASSMVELALQSSAGAPLVSASLSAAAGGSTMNPGLHPELDPGDLPPVPEITMKQPAILHPSAGGPTVSSQGGRDGAAVAHSATAAAYRAVDAPLDRAAGAGIDLSCDVDAALPPLPEVRSRHGMARGQEDPVCHPSVPLSQSQLKSAAGSTVAHVSDSSLEFDILPPPPTETCRRPQDGRAEQSLPSEQPAARADGRVEDAKSFVHLGKVPNGGRLFANMRRSPELPNNEHLERLFGPEQTMKRTMDLLLSLPEAEQIEMSKAENFPFTMEEPAPTLRRGERNTVVRVSPVGTLEAMQEAVKLGATSPVVLSFAHGYNAGGGFEHHGGSQEETLWRRTSLFLSIWPHRRADDGACVLRRGRWIGYYDDCLPRREAFYPMEECSAIYSPVVREVARDHAGAEFIQGEALAFAAITAAAQNVGFDPPFDPALLKQKVRTIFHIAAIKGHDAVILGAFGCGYFGNPIEEVANTFAEVLEEYAGSFSLVIFGVLGGQTHEIFRRRIPQGGTPQLRTS